MPLLVETETIKRIAVRLLSTYEDRQSLTAVRLLISLLQNDLVKILNNNAVYTALVAPSRPKKELHTDGRTHPHIESLRRD